MFLKTLFLCENFHSCCPWFHKLQTCGNHLKLYGISLLPITITFDSPKVCVCVCNTGTPVTIYTFVDNICPTNNCDRQYWNFHTNFMLGKQRTYAMYSPWMPPQHTRKLSCKNRLKKHIINYLNNLNAKSVRYWEAMCSPLLATTLHLCVQANVNTSKHCGQYQGQEKMITSIYRIVNRKCNYCDRSKYRVKKVNIGEMLA